MEPWYRFAVIVIRPTLALLFRRDFRGREHLPSSGPVIVAVNHVSHLDPFAVALYVHTSRRRPRFLGKASLFHVPFVKSVLRGAGQIPVYRGTADAMHAVSAAVDALGRGECVVVYPEGTVTKDPEQWPMTAKTGVARLALATGAPVIPMGQWGANEALGLDMRPHLLPRKTLRITVGPPVDLTRWLGRPLTAEVLDEATEAIMRDVRAIVGELRGEPVPETVYDHRQLPPRRDERRSA